MAIECLVKARTNPQHSGIDRRHFWAQGEVVSVQQSPAEWGRLEDPATDPNGTFWIITVEGVDLVDPIVQQLMVSGSEQPDGTTLSRRLRWIDVSILPNRLRAQLRSNGRLTIQARDLSDFNLATRVRVTERTNDVDVSP